MNAINKNEVRMFNVGDKVIRLDKKSPHIYSIQKVEDGVATITRKFRHKTWGTWLRLNEIELATPAEITADHRIDKSPLLQHLDKCEEVVKTWPKWKRQSIRDAFAIPNLDKTNCQQ